jgi:ABC-type phosphate transport system auxiliary subunit
MCGVYIEEGETMHITGQSNDTWNDTVLHREIERLRGENGDLRIRLDYLQEMADSAKESAITWENAHDQIQVELDHLREQFEQASTMLSLLVGSVGKVVQCQNDMFGLLYWQLIQVREGLTLPADQPF